MGYLSPTLSRRCIGHPNSGSSTSSTTTAPGGPKGAQTAEDSRVKLVLHCPPDLRDVIQEETTTLLVDPDTTLNRATAQYWAAHAARLTAHVHYAEFVAMLRRCSFAPAVALLDVDTRAFQYLLQLFESQGCAWGFAKSVVDAAVAGAPTLRELLKPDGVIYRVTGLLLQMKMRSFLRRALQPVFRHLFEQPEENYLVGTPDECLLPQPVPSGSSSVSTTTSTTASATSTATTASTSTTGPSGTPQPASSSSSSSSTATVAAANPATSGGTTSTASATGNGAGTDGQGAGNSSAGTGAGNGNMASATQMLTEKRQLHILNVTLLFLAAITEAVMSLPKEVRALAWYLQCSCQRFADFHEDAISGFIFARLFPPAVVAPERFGVFESCDGGEPLDTGRLTQNTVFVLKCVAKILLYSSTAQSSLARDQYLTSMQQEIECVKKQTFYMLHRIFVPTYAHAPATPMDALGAVPSEAGTEYTSLQDLLQSREEAFVPALRETCARLQDTTKHLAGCGDDICAFYDLCVERGLISRDTLASRLPADLLDGRRPPLHAAPPPAAAEAACDACDASTLAVDALRLGRTLLHPRFKYHVKVFQTDHYLDTDPLFGSLPVREWTLLSFCRHLNQDPQLEFVGPETYAQDTALLKQLSRIGSGSSNSEGARATQGEQQLELCERGVVPVLAAAVPRDPAQQPAVPRGPAAARDDAVPVAAAEQVPGVGGAAVGGHGEAVRVRRDDDAADAHRPDRQEVPRRRQHPAGGPDRAEAARARGVPALRRPAPHPRLRARARAAAQVVPPVVRRLRAPPPLLRGARARRL